MPSEAHVLYHLYVVVDVMIRLRTRLIREARICKLFSVSIMFRLGMRCASAIVRGVGTMSNLALDECQHIALALNQCQFVGVGAMQFWRWFNANTLVWRWTNAKNTSSLDQCQHIFIWRWIQNLALDQCHTYFGVALPLDQGFWRWAMTCCGVVSVFWALGENV